MEEIKPENIMPDYLLKDKERRLSISRVPKNTKEEFVKFSEMEFEGDYGMALKQIWDKYKESQSIFGDLKMQLTYVIHLLENKQNSSNSEQEERPIKILSGKVLKGGDKKHE